MQIFQEFCDDLQPKNSIQFVLVERIAQAILDLQRIKGVESAKIYNKNIHIRIGKLGKPIFGNVELNIYTKQEESEKEKLEGQLLDDALPDEVISRYKYEAENRLYKALKSWKEYS